jgi:murein DD-endopeptidase MepM/ murein hydrolase activator NlpD
MQPSPGRPSLLSRLTRALPIDSTVILVVLIAALAIGAGAMIVLGGSHPATPTATPSSAAVAALGSPHPTQTAVALPAGGATPVATATAMPAATGVPGATDLPATPAPTPEPTPEPEPTSQPPATLTGYVWPVINGRISSPFAARDGGFVMVDGKATHDGLDLATWCGDKVRAAHDGTVLYAGRKFDPFLGYSQPLGDFYSHISNLNALPIVIVIDDGDGYRSIYVHLSIAKVGAGDVVKAGQTIGYEGATGHATGCHLHYGLIRMDGPWQAVNPSLLNLYPPRVRERIDPLLVLPLRDPEAATKFLRQFPQPSQPGLPFDPPAPPDPGGD